MEDPGYGDQVEALLQLVRENGSGMFSFMQKYGNRETISHWARPDSPPLPVVNDVKIMQAYAILKHVKHKRSLFDRLVFFEGSLFCSTKHSSTPAKFLKKL